MGRRSRVEVDRLGLACARTARFWTAVMFFGGLWWGLWAHGHYTSSYHSIPWTTATTVVGFILLAGFSLMFGFFMGAVRAMLSAPAGPEFWSVPVTLSTQKDEARSSQARSRKR